MIVNGRKRFDTLSKEIIERRYPKRSGASRIERGYPAGNTDDLSFHPQ